MFSSLISENHMDKIKSAIQTELLKRGFLTPINIVFNEKRKLLEIHSESFQTVPVIFKSIKIDNFGGSIIIDNTLPKYVSSNNEIEVETEQELQIWIPIHVSYKHFDGGQNGCSLFNFTCKIKAKDKDRIYSISIN